VSGRIYRVTWALIAFPLLVAAFTVGRPDPLPRAGLPPSFDQAAAAQLARDFADVNPDRAPGGANAGEAASWVRERLEGYSLVVEEQRFQAELPGRGQVELVNLVARPPRVGPERSPEAIVVMADRDNLGTSPGFDRNASGTAALIELARDLSTINMAHTILFVSTDGGAWGGLGAAELARSDAFREDVLAVVNLDSVGGRGEPRVELAGDDSRSPAAALVATADASILAETERPAGHTSAFYQLLDLAFPFSLYGQAPLLGEGTSSLTLTTAGSRPPKPDDDVASATSADRLGQLGRAAQALVVSLDGAPEVASGAESHIYLGGRVLRGFAIELILFVALLPVLTAVVDLYARLRRRELALAPALRSLRSRLGVWLWGVGLAAIFTAVGLFPNGEPRPLPMDIPEAKHWPFAALAGLAVITGLGWLVARARLVPVAPTERSEELAGHLAAMLLLCATAVLLAVTNPYALLFILPSLHAWLWVPHVRGRRLLVRVAVYAAGFAGPILLLTAYAVRFGLGLDAPWYVTTLFTVGYAPVTLIAALVLWGASAGQIGAVLFGRYAPYPTEDERPVRGVLRESVRLTVLASRRLRRSPTGSEQAWIPEERIPAGERDPVPR
jgi:Peptidase family M28